MNNVTLSQNSLPTAYITKNKQRIKQNGKSVYLKDGDEFEIELFNPTNNKIKARITVNNTSIGPDVVLRPGERLFLERYTSNSHKFVFLTYNVNGTNVEVKRAIENNGDVKIEFYKEQEYYNGTITYTYYPYNTGGIYWSSPNVFYTCNGPVSGTYTLTSASGTVTNGVLNEIITPNTTSSPNIIETGRVERGSISEQNFTEDNSNFSYSPTWTVDWKILPMSQKVLEKKDLVVYCSGCGRKKRSNENFCPSCGRKF